MEKNKIKINLENAELNDKEETGEFKNFKLEGKFVDKTSTEEIRKILESKNVEIVYEVK